VILDLLKRRYSARRFLDRKIPDDIIQEMLEAASLAPSGGNEQAWAFGAITCVDLIRRIAGLSYGNAKWIVGSPLVVALCTRLTGGMPAENLRFPEYTSLPDERLKRAYMEEHQVKIPGTQMAMVALEHGIQCTWVSHFKVRETERVLRLPKGYLPTNLLAFGYPVGENPTTGGKPRKRDLKEIMFYNTGESLPSADQVPRWRWE